MKNLVRRRRVPLAVLSVGFASALPAAHADFTLHGWESHAVREKQILLTPHFTYYSTSTNYGPTGLIQTIAGLDRLTRLQGDVDARFGVTSILTVYGRFSWARVELTGTGVGGTVSQSGLTDQTVGASLRVFEQASPAAAGPITLEVQAQGDFPMYSNSASAAAGLPFMGNGSTDFTGGALISIPFAGTVASQWAAVLGAGYTYRSDLFSGAIPWSATIRKNSQGSGLVGSASILGTTSTQTDPRGSSTGTSSGAGAGGSFLVNAINPSLITARGALGYRVSPKVEIQADFAKSLWGQASPVGTSFGIGLTASLGSSVAESRPNRGFVSYGPEAKVVRANDRLSQIKIDRGSQDGVEAGQVYDIFSSAGGAPEAVARGKVISVETDSATISVDEYFKQVWIEEGFVAKRPLQ